MGFLIYEEHEMCFYYAPWKEVGFVYLIFMTNISVIKPEKTACVAYSTI